MPTLCFTGMDRAEEAKLKVLFSDANEWLGGHWVLVPEAQAQVIIVDLDSIYGHMTWLKVHNSGKHVIAITARTESDAEHVLVRPVTVESMVAALTEAVGKKAATAQPPLSAAQAMASARESGATAPEHAQPRPAPAAVAAAAPSASLAPTMREEILAKAGAPKEALVPRAAPSGAAQGARDAPTPPTRPTPEPPAASTAAPVTRAEQTHERAPAAAPPPSTPPRQQPRATAQARPRDPSLWDYLVPGGLQSPSRLDVAGLPPLVINPQSDTYFGTQVLKPYIPYCQLASVQATDWRSVAGDEFVILKATYGEPQPLARLRWLYALVQGKGVLASGFDANGKFRLLRWPKTEREFPRHLRIATTMMQGPGTPAEIAAKSDTPLPDVNDFINASIESGFAEQVGSQPSGPDPKSGGLLGRLRGNRG